ncbi:hypothetical protein O3M35_002006 [Rhynocoris fuscipes]|uniref:Chitin-binding type-2 domain-containing protein n=1 Tax=Rhynocoris fuscipes TaxID=488301 RepID=A0AAW1CQX5_9HEMI
MGPQCIFSILLVAIAISTTAHAQSLTQNIVRVGKYVQESLSRWLEQLAKPNPKTEQQLGKHENQQPGEKPGQVIESTQEQEQSTQENKPGSCKREGVYPVKGDCSKSYICAKTGTGFTKYYITCEPGKVWDPVSNVCNHPSVVKRNDCSLLNELTQGQSTQRSKSGSCKSEGVFSVQGDCTKFYQCVKNGIGFTKYDITCEHGKIWDPDRNVCNHPSVVKRNDCSLENESTEGQGQLTQRSKPGFCKSEGVYPVQGNCSKFYRCVSNGKGFAKYDFSCKPGTVWDPDNNVCNYPSEVKRKDCSQVNESTLGQGQTSPRQKPGSCESEGLYPVQGNCSKFYRCVSNGTGFAKYDFSCKPGTVWDPDYNACNYPSEVKRKDCSQVNESTLGQGQTSPRQKPGSCQSEGVYPVQGNCSKFYRCVDNGTGFTQHDFSCIPGAIFDSDSKVCTNPSAVKRKDCSQVNESTQGQVQSTQRSKPGSCESEGIYTVQGNCSKFYRCVSNGTGFAKYDFSCKPGTVWDPDNNVCNYPSEVKRKDCSQVNESTLGQGEKSPRQKPGSCESEGVYPVQGNCSKFYRCVSNGTGFAKYDFSCKPGAIFDSDSKVCTSPSAVKRKDCSQVNESTQGQGQSTQRSKPGSCESEGIYPVQGNCSKFYRCVSNGTGFAKYDFSCKPGTLWDPDNNVCNYPSEVKRKDCSQVNESTLGQGQTSPRQKPGSCESEGLYPVQGNCSKFYRCVSNGTGFAKYDFSCKPGAIFDSDSKVCTNPSAVKRNDCSQVNESTQGQGQSTQRSKPGSCESEGIYPVQGNCSKFYRCVSNGTGFAKYDFSCKPGAIFDSDSKVCTNPSAVKRNDCSQLKESTQGQGLPTQEQKPGSCKSDGFYPVQEDCSKFYRCVNNGAGFTKYEYPCKSGKIWDPDLKVCNYQWAVKRNDCTLLNQTIKVQGSRLPLDQQPVDPVRSWYQSILFV